MKCADGETLWTVFGEPWLCVTSTEQTIAVTAACIGCMLFGVFIGSVFSR